MPTQGVIMTEKQEGQAQLVWAAVLSAIFLVFYFGQPYFAWLGERTLLGIPFGDAASLALDGLWLAGIVWTTAKPPAAGRDAWVIAIVMILMPLSHWSMNRHWHPPIIVATSDLVVVAAGVVGGVSIIARRLWGTR
jgi:hypothetical protein